MRDSLTPLVPRVRDVLDEVYRVDRTPEEWLHGLGALPIFERELPSLAYIARRTPQGWQLVASDDKPSLPVVSQLRSVWETDKFDELVPPSVLSASQSDAMGVWPIPEPWRSVYDGAGIADVWSMFARSADDLMLCVAVASPRRVRPSPRSQEFWNSVAVHIATAARLRDSIDRREAVLSPDGTVLHAEGDARDKAEREALRLAARAIDRARAGKDDPLAALEAWTAMIRGRWTLVDEHESDGRRFLVARVNEPHLAPAAELTRREAHILALVKLGRSNKMIAYELGVSQSVVATMIGRIRKKLGVSRRAGLIE